MARLRRGDLLPEVLQPPPGPRCRALAGRLGATEAPGINTLLAGQPGLVWAEALGANVLDVDGNRFIDLTSGFGVAAVGHRHPRVVAAIRHQSTRLLHGLSDVHAHPLRTELAARLQAVAPVDDPLVYFGISGAEAVEIALKTALLATGRREVVAFSPAYHGLTLGALQLTSRPAFRQPFEPWLGMTVHRLPFGCPRELLAETLDAHPEVGAVVFEPIAGREGVILPPGGWTSALVEVCRQAGAVSLADEIFTGFGRTGRLFAVEQDGAHPDLVVCGKALGGGLPIAAVIGRRSLLEAWPREGEALHTATFVAHPLSCAAALAVLDILAAEELPERAARLGRPLGERLARWPERFPLLRQVRGRGLLWGLELASAAAAKELGQRLLARGVLALAGGPHGRVLQLAPPLTISEEQLQAALEHLEAAFEEVCHA